MAARTRAGAGGIGPFIWFVLGVAAVKVLSDEIAIIAEHGFDNWRRRRFGW